MDMNPEQIKNFKKKLIEPIKTSMGKATEDFTPVNEILTYGIAGDNIHIHLSDLKIFHGEKEKLVRDGLRKLATILQSKPEINKVSATSWIVAKHPKSIERLGFVVKGPISEEFRQKHFKDEKRPVHYSEISREEFITTYPPA